MFAICFNNTTLKPRALVRLYAHLHSLDVQKSTYWLLLLLVGVVVVTVLSSSLHYRSFFLVVCFRHIFVLDQKQTWNLWINAIIWFRRVFFFLQYMFSLHAPFIAWIFLYGSLCGFFSSSLSSVFVIWCNCTAWNAFNLFDLCALTCYIDVIAKSSNSSWNTRFVCVCVFLLLIFDP